MTVTGTVTIGVLALQGAFQEHIDMVKSIGHHAVAIRLPGQLKDLDGLILPGGESTTMAILLEKWSFVRPLREWIQETQKPIWGTCAGLILISDHIVNPKQGGQLSLGGFHGHVCRNYFGNQVRSFEAVIASPPGTTPQDQEYRAVFIRAPAIVSIEAGHDIEVLAQASMKTQHDEDQVIVAAKQGNILVTAFHPELTQDTRWHQYFIDTLVVPFMASTAPRL